MRFILNFLLCAIVFWSTLTYAEEHDLSVKNAGGKPATQQTQKANEAFARTLNFEDIRAFENNDKGLVAKFDQKTGDIIRNSFKFIDEDTAAKAPSTVNPSLWRQAVLNQKAEGLYEVLPGKILTVRYEDTVTDLEQQARSLLAHCDLAWDPAVLNFHKLKRPVWTASSGQVQKPIYNSSIGKWRPYEKHLGPLIEALGDVI